MLVLSEFYPPKAIFALIFSDKLLRSIWLEEESFIKIPYSSKFKKIPKEYKI